MMTSMSGQERPGPEAGRDAVVSAPSATLLSFDFDGTLSHVVADPAEAYAHEEAVSALGELGRHVGGVAIITGRPVEQVLRLGGFAARAGFERLIVYGQYGAERWDAATDETTRPPRPDSITELAERLPDVLAEHDTTEARIEDKHLSLAVHTRGLDDGALDRLLSPLRELGDDLGLHTELGRQVVELRAPGVDKGWAVHDVMARLGTRQIVFGGDDLGDLPAFEAVAELRRDGVTGLLICSASGEQDALVAHADLVLDGPDEVASWLRDLADDIAAAAS